MVYAYWQATLLSQWERQKRKEYLRVSRQARQNGEMEKLKEMQLERRQYTYRRWYMNNRDAELAKIRARKARRLEKNKIREIEKNKCCSSHPLGDQPPPENGVRLWICRCSTCHLVQYGLLGVDAQGQPGTHFRGQWFSFIYPDDGKGLTQSSNLISLK